MKRKLSKPAQTRGNPVEDAHKSIGIAKSEQRSRNECYGQKSENQLDPQWLRDTGRCGRKCPCLIQEKMRQKENGLQTCDENDYAL